MTSPTLARSVGGGRMYHWQGRDYPSVTTILNATVPKPALAPWAAKKVAEYAVANRGAVSALLDAGDERAAIDLLKGAPWRDRDKAGEVGTAVHAAAEAIANGIEPVALDPAILPFVPHFQQFLRDFNPEYIETEATVFSDLGYAGTFDAIARIHGKVWMLDTKTSASGVYADTALQLAAYAFADYIGRDDGETQDPIPACERFGVLHLRPEGYRLVPMAVDFEQRRQWKRLVESYEYLRGPHTKVMGKDVAA